MKKLKFIYVTAAALAFASCGQNGTKNQESEEQSEVTVTDSASVQTESAEEADTESVTSAPEEEVAEERKKQVSDEDWDAMLSSYERLVDSYIDCMTKYKAGDVAAMAEYASTMQEAQDYSEKLSKLQGELSPAQLKRYLEITEKLTKQLSESMN